MQSQWQDPPPPPPQDGGMQFAMPQMTGMVRRLIWINAAVFLVAFALDLFPTTQPLWRFLEQTFGIYPAGWIDWFPLVPVWQIFTWGFLHSTNDLFHILGNMLFLYFLGTLLEGILGARRFLFTYVGGLLFAGFATLPAGLITGDERVTIGASGAVLAIVVATAVLRPNTRVIFILFPITLKTLALLYVGIDVFSALMRFKGATSNVAHLAHLTGAAWGFLAARRGWIWLDPAERFDRWRNRRQVVQEERDSERLDRILGKIHSEGIHSLSSSEKAFLKRASKRR